MTAWRSVLCRKGMVSSWKPSSARLTSSVKMLFGWLAMYSPKEETPCGDASKLPSARTTLPCHTNVAIWCVPR